jgi:HSP20 family molecular chaperone IbpA
METETPQTTGAGETAASSKPVASAASHAQAWYGGIRKSTLALGSVAVLALGMLVGIGATRYVSGVPNAAAATLKGEARAAAPAAPRPPAAGAWNPFQEIRDMQLHMDRMFDQMSSQFRMEPRLSLFSDVPGYSLSLRVQDLKDRYEVRAYLPNAKAADVNVSLLDKQTLKVAVTNKSSETAGDKHAKERISEWGEYAQIIRLPAPVKSEQMKIDQPTHELIVTLPKAV